MESPDIGSNEGVLGPEGLLPQFAVLLVGDAIGTTDPINPGIWTNAGTLLIYRDASGLEKAMADTDSFRLMATYAELVRDQWDPHAISIDNIPYLAWAMGVNLWEDDWSEDFQRWWIANQWTMKAQRGSLLGAQNFVQAAGSGSLCPWGLEVLDAITPPAKFFPGASLTPAQRATYNARFDQLRVYPYWQGVQFPYLCYCSDFLVVPSPGATPQRVVNKNGCFLGPLQKFFPTNAGAGSRYTRYATVYDPQTGIETPITYRTLRHLPRNSF